MSSTASQTKLPTKYELLVRFIGKFRTFINGLALKVPNTTEFQGLVSQFRFLASKAPEELAAFAGSEILPYRNNLLALIQAKAKQMGVPLEQVNAEDVSKLVAYFEALCKILAA